jgi:methionyl-tRNA synthetase
MRVRRLNRYVEENRPWDLAKDPDQSGELDAVLYNLAEGLRVVTLVLHAYMPGTADRLLAALGEDGRELAAFGSRSGGQRVEKVPPLFPKIETAAA